MQLPMAAFYGLGLGIQAAAGLVAWFLLRAGRTWARWPLVGWGGGLAAQSLLIALEFATQDDRGDGVALLYVAFSILSGGLAAGFIVRGAASTRGVRKIR